MYLVHVSAAESDASELGFENTYPGLMLLDLIPSAASSWLSCRQKDLTNPLVPP